jgi:hypothetical protein
VLLDAAMMEKTSKNDARFLRVDRAAKADMRFHIRPGDSFGMALGA